MKAQLKKIWFFDDRPVTPGIEIRTDWDNNRHHGVKIQPPYTKDDVAFALDKMARLISNDKNLD